ncbi:MAG TPA: prolipoprotein diacylglyceryl transferase family protein [Acidobacteriaceae bacterium]
MYPYIHIGRFAIGTFGILLWLAAVSACWVLHRNLVRYRISDAHSGPDAIGIVAFVTIAGVIGAKLWHVLEQPAELMATPAAVLFDRAGFAWFGGLLGGILALAWQARAARLHPLTLLDLCTPAAAIGYGVGRIGCLTSGDGDYGIHTTLPWGMSFPHGLVPTTDHVHPTPVYEFLVALVIGALLWRQSAPSGGRLERRGLLTGEYLVLSGVARFLVEFIRTNPRLYFGLTNAQVASLATVLAGGLLVLRARRAPAVALEIAPAAVAAAHEVG